VKPTHKRLDRAKRAADLVRVCTVSIDQAIAVALSGIGGVVFNVKVKEMNQQPVWRVKLLRLGEEIKVYVDGRSGNILEAKAKVAVSAPHGEAAPEIHSVAFSHHH
jgi:uncharacterized membrane protein YkoI